MRRKPIHRGGIVSAGYDPVTRTLDIEFDTKRVLRYEGIGSEVAERFLCSAEPLSYYRDVIEEVGSFRYFLIEFSATELSAKALAETKKPAKKGIPDELRKLFGE